LRELLGIGSEMVIPEETSLIFDQLVSITAKKKNAVIRRREFRNGEDLSIIVTGSF
jgi:hypothetical protein